MGVCGADLIESDDLLDEQLQVIGDGKAGPTIVTADEIEDLFLKGLDCSSFAAVIKGLNLHEDSSSNL
jgi:hypothetical protein